MPQPKPIAALILTLLLAGCGPEGWGIAAGASAASIPVFHRTPVDMAVSAASGRDCSVVHLDKGEHYCHPKEQPPERPVFCTRSLGVPDCWADPERLPGHPREIADGPRGLTRDQDEDRRRLWLGL